MKKKKANGTSKLKYLEDDSLPAPKSCERRLRDIWEYGGSLVTNMSGFVGCDPRKFMTPKECRKFDALPDEFTIYRGFQGGNHNGRSWSLSLEVAKMFTTLREELPPGQIIERRVKKLEVFACLDTDEQEVVIF
jgi:hypothetical protein